MALMTPTLLSSVAFDATVKHTFEFTVSGGDQVVGNTLYIYLNDGTSTTPVYSGAITSYKLEHELPANTLQNGQYYKAQIRTRNSSGATSSLSNTIQFRCFNTPSFGFTNIPATNIINNSSFEFTARFAKAVATDIIDVIQSYIFTLYDTSGVQISTSGLKYFTTEQTPPVDVSYTFKGFVNNTQYKVRAVASTVNGMVLDTGMITITAQYQQPTAFSLLSIDNICEDGYMRIVSSVVIIDGIAVPDPPQYIEGKEISLLSSGSSVSWEDGFSISGDFTLGLWGRRFVNNAQIYLMNNDSDSSDNKYRIELYCRTGYPWDSTATQKMYIECYIYSGNDTPAYVYSNYIDTPATTDTICIWLKRKDNIFDLEILNKGGSA